MKLEQIQNHYRKFYESVAFERVGLFECAKREFGDGEVLYLGSSAHITPSFIFRNVTYLDHSEISRDFFSDLGAVRQFIESRKRYQPSPTLAYVDADYTSRKAHKRYDLVWAIFSPGSLTAAQSYVNRGGILVYLPLPSEEGKSDFAPEFEEIGMIRLVKGKYKYSADKWVREKQKKDMVDNKFRDVYVYSVLKRV